PSDRRRGLALAAPRGRGPLVLRLFTHPDGSGHPSPRRPGPEADDADPAGEHAMAQGKDQLDDRAQPGSQQARANIDVTRQAMDRTIEAIEGKLTPGQLLMEGLSLLGKGGTTGANKLVELAREHPVPAAVIGVGVGMMIRDAATKKTGAGRPAAGYASGYGYEGPGVASRTVQDAKERVAEVAQSARETVSHTVHDARDSVAGAARSARE